MKKRTRWKRVYNPVIGVKFFDAGEYALGFFTIEKLWTCKEYVRCAQHWDGEKYSNWFDKTMMQIRTDTGLVYKMPFFPWMKVYDDGGKKSLGDYYNEDSFMTRSKR